MIQTYIRSVVVFCIALSMSACQIMGGGDEKDSSEQPVTFQQDTGLEGLAVTATISVSDVTINVQEDVPVILNLLVANSETLPNVMSIEQPDQGGLVEQLDVGQFRYTPLANYFGTESFAYTVEDGNGGETTATVTVNVTPVNDLPIAEVDALALSEGQSTNLTNLLDNDSDVDGDILSIVSFSQGDNGGVIELLEDGSLQYTPNSDYFGIERFSYEVSDGQGGVSTASVIALIEEGAAQSEETTVLETTISAEDVTVATNEDLPMIFTLLTASEASSANILSFSQASEGGVVELFDASLIKYTPTENYSGTEFFTYTVDNGNGEEISATVTVNVASVNDAPIVQGEVILVEEDSVTFLTDLLNNDSDPEGDTLILESVTHGDNNGRVRIMGDGSVEYTPQPDYFGIETFTYTVSDGNGGSTTATVMAQVNSGNDQPLAQADVLTLTQNQQATLDVLENDSGLGDGVNVTLVSQPSNGIATVNDDGSISYTPNDDYFGSDSFSYQLTDADGEISVANANINIPCVTNCSYTFEVTWDASPTEGINTYKVYVGTDPNNLINEYEVADVNQFFYKVSEKGEYYFSVASVNDTGVLSERTAVESGIF